MATAEFGVLNAPTQYVTNRVTFVRVDGVAVRVPASTRLPEGVEEGEIARLLRFGVIRPYEPEPTPEPAVEEPAPRRPRKKTPEPEPEPTPEE